MNDNSTGPIKIDVGAKLEIKTEVPAQASGRIVNAFADVVSPLTEWLGLQGDKLRIHRQVVVTETIRRAEERLARHPKRIHPVPVKIAVPLLEHASQEEIDDDFMIDMWSRLLQSAATSTDVSPRFVAILGEMNSRQARLLIEIAGYKPRIGAQDRDAVMIASLARTIVRPSNSPQSVQQLVAKEVTKFGYYVTAITWIHTVTGLFAGHVVHENTIEEAVDLDILASLGLIKRNHATDLFENKLRVTIEYVTLSTLGGALIQLVRSCPGASTSKSPD